MFDSTYYNNKKEEIKKRIQRLKDSYLQKIVQDTVNFLQEQQEKQNDFEEIVRLEKKEEEKKENEK